MVYIAKWLWTEPWEEAEGIIGVYTTEEGAKRAVEAYLKEHGEYSYDGAEVEEWELND